MDDDHELLRRYAETGDEEAFTEVTRRTAGLVYATARRVLQGNGALAEDATQAVFAELARKAGTLSKHPVLTGWLHTSARFAALKLARAERRRRRHEEAAVALKREEAGEAAWAQMRPWIDEAVGRLNTAEREAVLLRYFAEKSHREVGEALGMNESAARMRVERSLEKMRTHFARRGVATTAALLATTLEAHAGSSAAPAGVAARAASRALQSSTAAPAAAGKWLAAAALTAMASGWAWWQFEPGPQPTAAANKAFMAGPLAPTANYPLAFNPQTTMNPAPLLGAVVLSAAVLTTTPAAQATADAPENATVQMETSADSQEGTQTAGTGQPAQQSATRAGWTKVAPGQMQSVRALAWLQDRFVAVGEGPILSSPDGLTWTAHTGAGNVSLHSILKHGDLYVAAGEEGVIMTSPDLDKWTKAETGTKDRFYSAYWTGNQFVVLGNNGRVATSPDGAEWQMTQPPSARGAYFHGGVWTGKLLVVSSHNAIAISPDGQEWRWVQVGTPLMLDVAWSGNALVEAGQGVVYTSRDAVTWTAVKPDATATGYATVIWTGREFLVAEGGMIDSSPDGLAWTSHKVDESSQFTALAEHNGILVAGSWDGGLITHAPVAEVKGGNTTTGAPPSGP